jgi:ribosomal protein L40E
LQFLDGKIGSQELLESGRSNKGGKVCMDCDADCDDDASKCHKCGSKNLTESKLIDQCRQTANQIGESAVILQVNGKNAVVPASDVPTDDKDGAQVIFIAHPSK